MKNAVLMAVYNNLALTKAAVESVLAQDVEGGINLWFVDNGSTDDTYAWALQLAADNPHVWVWRNAQNKSPVKVANEFFGLIYEKGYQHILGVPNDVVLPPNFYRELLKWPRGIVTASMTDQHEFAIHLEPRAVSEQTPMAVALVRRWAHDALVAKDGYLLDPGFFHYASDCDMALRMAACGIHGIQLDMPYYHYSSAALRRAPPAEARLHCQQADRDRDYFRRKWGFAVSAVQYGERCSDINFRG